MQINVLDSVIAGASGGAPLLVYLWFTMKDMKISIKEMDTKIGTLQIKAASTEYLQKELDSHREHLGRIDKELKIIIAKVGA